MSATRCFFRQPSSWLALLVIAALLISAGLVRAENSGKGETIVFMRHGEKPDAGLGQLNCKGLNRSLALPGVLARQFGKPDAIFAPDPSRQKDDDGTLYDYVRPVATIEPTAIAAGLPVGTAFGYDEIDKLQAALTAPKYASSTLFVAWEHKEIVKLAKALLKQNGGKKADVPKWEGSDFDSLYVVHLPPKGSSQGATIDIRAEHLNALPDTCPK